MSGPIGVEIDLTPLDGAIAHMSAGLLANLVEAGALICRDAVVEGMEDAPARTGREYLIPGTKTPYTASAPGEPPAIRETHYRDSWKGSPAVVTGDSVRAEAYSDLETEDGEHLIGAILEFGAPKVPIEARPHVAPQVPRMRNDLNRLVAQASR